MRVLSKTTLKSRAQVLEYAISYFSELFGFTVVEHVPQCCVEFSGGEGTVSVQVVPCGKELEVVLTASTWDNKVLDFIESV